MFVWIWVRGMNDGGKILCELFFFLFRLMSEGGWAMVCSCVGWTVPGMFFLEEGGEVRCGLHRVVENYIYDVH